MSLETEFRFRANKKLFYCQMKVQGRLVTVTVPGWPEEVGTDRRQHTGNRGPPFDPRAIPRKEVVIREACGGIPRWATTLKLNFEAAIRKSGIRARCGWREGE